MNMNTFEMDSNTNTLLFYKSICIQIHRKVYLNTYEYEYEYENPRPITHLALDLDLQ